MHLTKGYPPAVREICEAVHLKSTSSVHAHLESLEEKGYIRKDPTKPRAIEILDDEFNLARREVINVPIVGTVTCGEPILAEQNIQGYFPIPPEYLHANGKNTFMLKVKGDSMINAGIFDGDLVMCEEAQTARNAEMVVALIDDSATVKLTTKKPVTTGYNQKMTRWTQSSFRTENSRFSERSSDCSVRSRNGCPYTINIGHTT